MSMMKRPAAPRRSYRRRYKHRVQLEEPSETVDSWGQTQVTYTPKRIVACEIRDVSSGGERVRGGAQVSATVDTVVRMRYPYGSEQPKAKWRCVEYAEDGTARRILNVDTTQEFNRKELWLHCTEEKT